jgi:hypothetical protein
VHPGHGAQLVAVEQDAGQELGRGRRAVGHRRRRRAGSPAQPTPAGRRRARPARARHVMRGGSGWPHEGRRQGCDRARARRRRRAVAGRSGRDGCRHSADPRRCDIVVRSQVLPRGVDLAGIEAVLDHAQRQVVPSLFGEDHAEQLDVGLVELAVAGRRALRGDEALALEEPDLGDRDVGELLEQQAQDLPDREVAGGLGDLSHRSARRRRA